MYSIVFCLVNQIVQSRDKIDGEVSVMSQCRFLHTPRFGPDVVASTLCCEEDGLPNLLIVEEGHGKTNCHCSSDPLHVHLLSCPSALEWVRPTIHFVHSAETPSKDVIQGTVVKDYVKRQPGTIPGLLPVTGWRLGAHGPKSPGRDKERL